MNAEQNDLEMEISVQEVKQMLDDDVPVCLIDCREQVEYRICRIEPAQLIPMNETPGRLEEFKQVSERIIVF